MRILVCSDIHADFGNQPDFTIDPNLWDIAFICGDICNHAKNTLNVMLKFKEKVLHNKPSVVVAGNHDRWGSLFSSSEYFLQQIPGYLNRQEIEFQGHRILGCTLWYKPSIHARKHDWSDYENITDWENIRSEHDQDMKFLDDEMREDDIVVTHMMPSYETVSARYIGSPYNSFYVTELDSLFKARKPKLWCMGHSHDPLNKMIGDTLFIRNPLGYPSENNKFQWWIVDTNKIGEYDAVTGIDLPPRMRNGKTL